MLHNKRRRQSARSLCWSNSGPQARPVPCDAPGALSPETQVARKPTVRLIGQHPLSNESDNTRLYQYEQRVKQAFDTIVPALKNIAALQYDKDFEVQAQRVAREQLGFELPAQIIADAWIEKLDMRRLFAWSVFETYHRFCDDFFLHDNLIEDESFQSFLMDCGFHTLDVSPCSDGRLAHVISYVLRLPYRAVRRKSYAGAMFDIQDSMDKWTETELIRFREGRPNTSDEPTRYLKTVVYHFSSMHPDTEGCAAHGSDTGLAAKAGLEQLQAFQQAVENSYCCGASIDLLLIGLDTDTDAIRVHVPNAQGEIDVDTFVDTATLYDKTLSMSASQAQKAIADHIESLADDTAPGMLRFITSLVVNNFSQVEYVRHYHTGQYEDAGHAERFIGAGIGFEEIQMRNLTFFAYMHTVEEAASDLDIGVKIFSSLNVAHGLPIPIVVRFDYHGHVPGARERAIENCQRVNQALSARYGQLVEQGLLHTLLVIRDCHAGEKIEVLASSVNPTQQEAH